MARENHDALDSSGIGRCVLLGRFIVLGNAGAIICFLLSPAASLLISVYMIVHGVDRIAWKLMSWLDPIEYLISDSFGGPYLFVVSVFLARRLDCGFVGVSIIKNLGLSGGYNGPKLAVDCIVIFGFFRRRPSDQLRAMADGRAAMQRWARWCGALRSAH
jgi:hypothetical protein